MEFIKKIYSNNKWMFSILVLMSMAIYFPIRKAGIIMDYLGWLYKYEAGSYADVINCFGYQGLHQVFHLVNYSIYRLVGADPVGQYVIFSISHGIVTFLLLLLLKKLAKVHRVDHAVPIVLFTILLFLISPYQVEVVTWKACYHYLMVTGFIYSGYYNLIRYLESRRTTYLVYHHLLFALALFSLEIALAAPFMFIAYSIFYYYDKKSTSYWSTFIKTGMVQLIILGLYFALNKYILGDWVGHYGADTHLDIKPDALFGTGLQYFFKRLFLIHYLPYKVKHLIYSTIVTPVVYYSLTAILLAIFAWFVYRFKTLEARIRLAGLGILNFFMSIFPIITLYFMYIFWYENDRYGYLGSGFLYFSLILLVFSFPRFWRRTFIYSYVALTLFLFVRMSTRVYEGTEIFSSLLEDFRWYDAEEVVILSLPVNYHGLFMFVDYTEVANEFKEALYWHLGKKMEKPMHGITQFNMAEPDDKIGVNVVGENKLQVMIGQGGTWFWRLGYGLTDFENEEFKVEKKDWYFMLDIKKPKPGRVYIYSDGGKWKQVDFNKKE